MFTFQAVPQHELAVIIRNAAQKMGVHEAILEKDYWVCFVLNYLFSHGKWRHCFTFKGGTSLSKCFHLIERFSEDIDLILDWREVGFSATEPWDLRSHTQQEKFNKTANQKTAIFLLQNFLPKIKSDFKELLIDDFNIRVDDNDSQTVLFEYPKIFESRAITPAVRLEIGMLAAWTPSAIIEIVPELMKVYPVLFDGGAIAVKAVLPERIFWEKATILHHEANRPKHLSIPKRYARHYYDLYCLAKSSYKTSALQQIDLLEKVVAFKQKFYPRRWAKYEEATIQHLRILPDDYRFQEIKADYRNMKDMFYGNYPSFDEIISVLRELEDEIHQFH